MMKKFFSIITSVVFAIVAFTTVLFINFNKNNCLAETNYINVAKIQETILTEIKSFIEYDTSIASRTRNSRIAGSKAEYESAMYIKNRLEGLKNFKFVNNLSTEDGIERFQFESVYDGKTYNSQNVIIKRESVIETDRKIVIGAHYDTAFISDGENKYESGVGVVNDGVNDNAAAVAILISLIKSLDKVVLDYGYDLEFVFFGAGANNHDGSKYYVRGLNEEEAKNILLMINLDKVGLGEYNYAYVNEFNTSQEDYILSTTNLTKLNTNKVVHYNNKSVDGLNYSHIGLESDHVSFMNRNINVLNLFSGNYEEPFTYGLNEYENKTALTYTLNDNLTYIVGGYSSSFYYNLYNVYNNIDLLLKDDSLLTEMEKNNKVSDDYIFWTNEKVAVFITSILLIVLTFVCFMIYHYLHKNSKKAFNNSNIDKIVLKITSNISKEDDKELNDALDYKIKKDTDKDKE